MDVRNTNIYDLYSAKRDRLEAYMVLIAASIPTLKPVIRRKGTETGRSDDHSSSFTLRKISNAVGRYRGTDGQWATLSEDIPSSNDGDSHIPNTGAHSSNLDTSANTSGITKSTTVTLSRS